MEVKSESKLIIFSSQSMQTIYSRLSDFKSHAAVLAKSAHERRLSPLALDLGLTAPVPVIDEGDNPPEHFYEHALDLAEKLFDAEIDQSAYEEALRYMAGIKAYPLFTVDKLIATLIKHVRSSSLASLITRRREAYLFAKRYRYTRSIVMLDVKISSHFWKLIEQKNSRQLNSKLPIDQKLKNI